ncbi:class I SAM-dependent methyltransferase [Paenibacillus sp. GCM10027626]|uniref:class I SAM-dependent methyltransferase n=1 Tax=Paenibacillus sp. GCM10027626 TaxID=3273411 RepID=UPI003635F793
MPDHARIYIEEAEKYHLLISKQPLLHDVIEEVRPTTGLDIVDVGAGTGRLTAVLASKARSIIAIDESAGMLEVNAKRLKELGLGNWRTIVAEHRKLPLENASADLVVAGWTIAYLANDEVEDGEGNLNAAIAEMKRVLRPGGTIIIFETMGTGEKQPNPPAILKNYYKRLQEEYHFSYKWIRMDYTFENTEQAEELTRFFFGDALADRVKQEQLKTVPECAGVWWLHI